MDFVFEHTGNIFALVIVVIVFINRKIKDKKFSKSDIVDVDYEIIYTTKNSIFTRFYTPWD